MASTIVTKNSSTASAVPTAGQLTKGELAVNVTDKKIYTKDNGGSVVKVVGGLGNQEANAVAITGGNIDGTAIGATTKADAYVNNLRLYGSSSGYVGLKGAAAAGSTIYTLPSADGTSGQMLSTNGTGTLSWATASSGSSFAGPSATVYTTSGSHTFTIPSGVTKLKVTVVGGGGSSNGWNGCTYTTGNTGGTSSVASGTQTISTISATGGAGGNPFAPSNTSGGVGSGGDLNGYGGSASQGTSILSGYRSQNNAGVLGATGNTAQGGPGCGGGNAIKWLTGLTSGNTLSITVGAGGSAPTGGYAGGAGAVIIEY